MYSALEIAKYVVDKSFSENHPISNLQLQKILYCIKREFLQREKEIFPEKIEAWQFGPVVPEVYKVFCGFGGSPIRIRFDIELNQDDRKAIDLIALEKCRMPNFALADDICAPQKAWAITYQDGAGDHRIVPDELIQNCG